VGDGDIEKAGDLDPQEYFDGLRDSFHPQRYTFKVAGEVLRSDVGLHRTFSRSVSTWRWPLWGVALKSVVPHRPEHGEGSRWRADAVFGEDFHRAAAPDLSMVQTGLGEREAVLTEGALVVAYEDEGEERKFVLSVGQGWQSVSVKALADGDQQEAVADLFKDIERWIAKNNFYRGQKIDADGKFLELEDVSEEDLILDKDTKRELFRNVKLMVDRHEDYAKWNIPSNRGVILAGPPGNGKTLSMKVLAKLLDCTFMWVSPAHVENGFAAIYEFARELAPTVVLLEDADSFGLDRRIGGFNGALGELLGILDGFEKNRGVITILSSNYAEVLDSALTQRPGRFDTKIRIDPPGVVEAFEIMTRTLDRRKTVYQGNPGALKNIAAQLVASQASGAYVVEVVNYASILAVENGRGRGAQLVVTEEDFNLSAGRVIAHLGLDSRVEMAVAQEGILKWGGWPKGSFHGQEGT